MSERLTANAVDLGEVALKIGGIYFLFGSLAAIPKLSLLAVAADPHAAEGAVVSTLFLVVGFLALALALLRWGRRLSELIFGGGEAPRFDAPVQSLKEAGFRLLGAYFVVLHLSGVVGHTGTALSIQHRGSVDWPFLVGDASGVVAGLVLLAGARHLSMLWANLRPLSSSDAGDNAP